VAVGLLLVFGVLGGLQRLGIAPWPAVTAPASLAHAALMIGGWLGSVIGLERAVALKTRSARLAPLLSLLAGGGLLVPGADRCWPQPCCGPRRRPSSSPTCSCGGASAPPTPPYWAWRRCAGGWATQPGCCGVGRRMTASWRPG
jgi:hypothetical protein